jgi:RNA polymerase sigma-70 factor (ECF subfamily)
MGKTPRNNQDWIASLSASGEMQESALRDLRELLVLGLGRTFSPQGEAFIQDAAQVALLQILKNLTSFAGKSKFSTWAMAIAVRIALSDLRKSKWRHVSLEEMTESRESQELADSSAADPSRINSQNCIKEKLHELVKNILTEKQRMAILAELNGVPLEEIAVKQASSLNATYKLLHDARKRLKVALEESSINIEDVAHAFSN